VKIPFLPLDFFFFFFSWNPPAEFVRAPDCLRSPAPQALLLRLCSRVLVPMSNRPWSGSGFDSGLWFSFAVTPVLTPSREQARAGQFSFLAVERAGLLRFLLVSRAGKCSWPAKSSAVLFFRARSCLAAQSFCPSRFGLAAWIFADLPCVIVDFYRWKSVLFLSRRI
jgi:hypothetical protein